MKRRRRKLDKGQIVQRKDYAQKAKRYGHTHDFSDTKEDLHVKALEHIMPYIDRYAIESIIDIGSGTARPLLYLQDKRPQLKITGIEPVKEFIDIAEANGFPEGDIIQGYGDRLPFPNDSFDAACEFGVLHHASHPKRIVSEMMRVSKKAIFISDTNRFGSGGILSGIVKFIIYKLGLWNALLFVLRGGKRWVLTDHDSVVYSYSVYDSYKALYTWADHIILIPLNSDKKKKTWFSPLFNSKNVLLCAFRNR